MNKSIPKRKRGKKKKEELSNEEKAKRKEEFAKIGEPSKEDRIETIKVDRPIYYNGHQYTVKLPKEIAKAINFQQGDKIRYTVILDMDKKDPIIKIDYIKNNGI